MLYKVYSHLAFAVLTGWDADISDNEVLRRLLELNKERAV